MSTQIVQIPSDGTAVSIASVGPQKSWNLTGTFAGTVALEISQDGVVWDTIAQGQQGFPPVEKEFVALFARIRSIEDFSNGRAFISGASAVDQATLVNIPVTVDGSQSATIETFSELKTLVVDGDLIANKISIEVSNDGEFTPIASFANTDEGPITLAGAWKKIRARIIGYVSGSATLQMGGYLPIPANHPADWDPTLVRYFFVDNDNGDDSNVGYIDAAAETEFESADTTAVAIKTLEQLRDLLPRFGSARAAVVLIKPRSDGGNYLNKSGLNDYLDIGYSSYRYCYMRGSDHTNNSVDQARMGGITAESGPNADGSWTVQTQAGAQTTVAAGVLPDLGTLAGLKLRFAGNVTSALVDRGNTASDRIDDTNFNLASSAALIVPAAGDQFFLDRPGVKVTTLRGIPVATNYNTFSGSNPNGMGIGGIEITEATGGFAANAEIKANFMRSASSVDLQRGAFNSTGSWTNEAGTVVSIGSSWDARGSFDAFFMNLITMQFAAYHGATRMIDNRFMTLGGSSIALDTFSVFYGSATMPAAESTLFGNSIGPVNNGTEDFKCRQGINLQGYAGLIANVSLDQSTAGIVFEGRNVVGMRNIIGALSGGATIFDLSAAENTEAEFASGITATTSGTAVALGGAVNRTLAEVAAGSFRDNRSNHVFTGGFESQRRITPGTIGNYPILSADPGSPSNGDVWILENGGTHQLGWQAGGVVYHVTGTP